MTDLGIISRPDGLDELDKKNPSNAVDESGEPIFVYKGHTDDRPLLWRTPLNELVDALNEMMIKRNKKLGHVLGEANNMDDTPYDDDNIEPDTSRPGRARPTSRSAGSRRSGRASRERPASSRPMSSREKIRALEEELEDDDWEDLEDDLDDLEGLGPAGAVGDRADREPGGADGQQEVDPAKVAERKRMREEYKAKQAELERIRAEIASDDVLLRLRKQYSQDLGSAAVECDESLEQSRTWIKALEDVLQKRSDKLAEHDKKTQKAQQVIDESEAELDSLDGIFNTAETKHIRDQIEMTNTVKVENKTGDLWRTLEEDMRSLHKQTETEGGEAQREQLRLSKHLQDLLVGEQEVAKRLAQQRHMEEEILAEGKQLQKYWRREYVQSEMQVSGAVAEVEAEDRARSHLVGHGERMRGKMEAATGHLAAQQNTVEEEHTMDVKLKEQTEDIESQIKQIQLQIDEQEELKESFQRQKDEIQLACQDKVEYLNSQLRAIETSANAVSTEQAIAQKTLASSEEALETLEPSEARARLEEDVEALRQSLVSIEARLQEVQKDRAAVRETRGKTQKEAMTRAHDVQAEIDNVDAKVQEMLGKRVQLESDLRNLDGQRVVIHARVKQSRKAITPLEQERKLYEAELEWVREFEEHSFMRMQEKHEAKVQLQEELESLKKKGAAQLKEQNEDEGIMCEGVRAIQELKEKISLHKAHVEGKLQQVESTVACREAEAASLAATQQALDGKVVEAEDAATEAEERRLGEQSDWDAKDLDFKGKQKDLNTRIRKESRLVSQLQEARKVLKEELEEVQNQLADQKHAASNAASQSTSIRGEKQATDLLIREMEERIQRSSEREEYLIEQIVNLKRAIVRTKVGNRYSEDIGH